jgi:hypothetical protein
VTGMSRTKKSVNGTNSVKTGINAPTLRNADANSALLAYLSGAITIEDLANKLNINARSAKGLSVREGWTRLRQEYAANIRKYSILRYSDKLLDQIASFQNDERKALRNALDKMDKEFEELSLRVCPACSGDGTKDDEGKCPMCYGSGKTPLNMRDYHVYFEARESAQKQLNRSYGIADRVDISVDVLSLMPRRTKEQEIAEIESVKCSKDDIIPEFTVDDSAQDAPGSTQNDGEHISVPPDSEPQEGDNADIPQGRIHPPQKNIECIDKLVPKEYEQYLIDEGFISGEDAIYVRQDGDPEAEAEAGPFLHPLPIIPPLTKEGVCQTNDPRAPDPTPHPQLAQCGESEIDHVNGGEDE